MRHTVILESKGYRKKMKKNWIFQQKPSEEICPEKFCFMWHEKGSSLAKGFHNSLEEALRKLEKVEKSYCGVNSISGSPVCRRESKNTKDHDFYEPCEPYLKKAKLPWFYFLSKCQVQSLNEKDRKKYFEYFNQTKKNEFLLFWKNLLANLLNRSKV